MGRITSPTRHASQSIVVLKRQPEGLLIGSPQWRSQLQSAYIGTPWRVDQNVRKPRQKKNLWREKQAWLLWWYIIGTLPLFLGLDVREQENKRVRYCDFKTQIYHKSFYHNRR